MKKSLRVAVGRGLETLPLMKEALDRKLCYTYGEAIILFRAFLDDEPYVPHHFFGKVAKRGATPEHLRMACLYDGETMVAWAVQWLDVRYSITDEFWRYTTPERRNRGYQKLLVTTLKETA